MKFLDLIRSPIVLPIFFFMFVILLGSIALHGTAKDNMEALSWTDAVFTATSAACVTGLTVVDTGSYFTTFGQWVIMLLIQIGGLGIMTFTSISIYLWRRKTTITDRIAVGQVLLHDARFNLGRFLIDIVKWTFLIEAVGAILLYLMEPRAFTPMSAVFHSVSAFCNAGFSLFTDSLNDWKGEWGINMVFMVLIILGGIGFSVFIESKEFVTGLVRRSTGRKRLSWYALIVLKTSLFLIVLGWAGIYFAEYIGYNRMMATDDAVLTALFQSVTARTAGFNTLNIGHMTNVSLLILLFLMFMGGAPGSCAGGIKVTTFRVLVSVIWSQLRGKKQAFIGRFAVSEQDVKKAMVLFILASLIIFMAVFLLDFTEGGDTPHHLLRGQYLELLFESVSAFCTVGLSTGITSSLSVPGKWIIVLLMFTGRLGPLTLVNALQRFQEIQYFKLPEENVMIG